MYGTAARGDFIFKLLKPSVEVTLSDRLPDELAANANLFTLSNTYGYFVAGQKEGFLIDKLSSLRSAFENGEADAPNKYSEAARVEIAGETVSCIRLSADELTVIIGMKGGLIYLYSVAKLLAKTKGAKPIASLDLGSEIQDIRPNPATDRNGLMAVLLENGSIQMINMDGTVAASLILTISWLETSVFVVVYTDPPEQDGMPSYITDFCIVSKEDKTKTKFISLGEICFPIPPEFAATNFYISSSLKTLSKNFKEFMVVGYAASTDLGIVAREQGGDWMLLDLQDVGKPIVQGADPCPVGMAIDLTSTQPLEPLEEDGAEVSPAPIFYVYSNLGKLSAYNILDLPFAKQGLPCASIVQTKALPQVTPASKTASAPKAASATKTAPASKVASSTPPATKATTGPLSSSAETKASAGFSFGAAVAASGKPAVASPAGFKVPGTGVSKVLETSTVPKVAFGASNSAFGSTLLPPSAASRSSAPNPVVDPNPAFHQSKPAPTPAKPPGTMQKILQENEAPFRLNRKKSVADTPSASAPKVSAAMDALSRQLENTYLAMTEELKTLHSHVRETEELVKAREHVFGELDQFMHVIEKRIKVAEDTKNLAKSVLGEFANLQMDLVKVTTKREEIGKLLEARKDPNLLEKVLSSELDPAQATMKNKMIQAIESVDNRISELEQHVQNLHKEARRLRQGYVPEYPALDSIRRSILNISAALASRQSDLDQLSSELDSLTITKPIKPQETISTETSEKEHSKGATHSKSISYMPMRHPSEQSKNALTRELRRVFTSDPRSTAILNSPGSSTVKAPLSVLPKLKEVEFVPMFEPRRSERKKRLAAVTSLQPELPLTAATPSSAPVLAPVPASLSAAPVATPAKSFDQPTPAFGLSPAASFSSMATTAAAFTPPPTFGATNPLSAPTFGNSQVSSPFGSVPSPMAPVTAVPAFGTSSSPTFGVTPAATAPMSFGLAKAPAPSGVQAPKSGPTAAPAFSGFQVPKSETSATPLSSVGPTFSAAPTFSTPPLFSAIPTSQPTWSLAKTSAPPQPTFAGFQVPTPVDTTAKATPAPAFSLTKVEPQPREDDGHDDEEGQGDEEPQEDDRAEYEDEEDEEAEYEDEEDGHYSQARYEHDGQVYDLGDDGSEPETWGSDTDQRDYDQGEDEGEEDEGEEGPYDEEGEEEEEEQEEDKPEPVSLEKKDSASKSAWAAPGFSFPATAPVTSSAGAESSKPVFSFAAAVNKGKGSESKATPAVQSPFGTTGANTFGSTTTFAFGAPQVATSKTAPASAFGQKPISASEVTKSTPASREQAKIEESDDEQEDQEEEEVQEEEEEEEEGSDDDGDQEVLGSEVEEEGDFDGGSEVEEVGDAGNVEDEEDSDKESALTAVQLKGSFAPPTVPSVKKSSGLETSGPESSKISFGAAPAFGSASDAKPPGKGLDMSFAKLPRARKGSRDSLDSNTTDEEDQVAPTGSEPSSPVLGFGNVSLSNKGTSGDLDSFNLSLGGEKAKAEKKSTSAWGESSFSSWGTASQTSAPQSAWGSGSNFGSSQSTSSAYPFATAPTSGPSTTASPFAAVTSTPLSSAATTSNTPAWGSGGFGQTSSLGSGFGGASAGFGQTSQVPKTTGSGFGQSSQLGSGTGFGQTATSGSSTGFGQTSTLGAGSGFGQTSTLGAGTGFGQPSTAGSSTGFGQTSTLGAGTGFGQTAALGAGAGFGQTATLGGGTGFGQTSQLGSGTAFGQKSQMGGGFGQTAFGQPSAFSKPAASAFGSASTQSNFGSFASTGTNAFAAARSNVNVLDEQSGGSAFGSGGGFNDSGASAFGSGGGFGGASGNTAFGGASTTFGGAAANTGGFASFASGGATGGGAFGAPAAQSGFGAAAAQGTSVFGQPQQGQGNTGFGTGQANINPNKPAFSSFR
ncbi:hypothetical protein EC991_010980 [Linnemannia zychae]|nr:hypothetical protein EC991_010980 [Linnemannia zychae]